MSVPSYTILVTDGEQRAALAAVRSLGAAGHTVHVVSENGHSMAGGSKFATDDHRAANSLDSESQFVDDVQQIARRIDAQLIIPITEASLLALLPHVEKFDAVIPFATLDQFQRISNKQLLLETANNIGIPIPQQHAVQTPDEAQKLVDQLQYPIVVKPARSVADGESERLKLTVQHAHDASQLRDILNEMSPRAYPLLLQQRIVGPGVGVFLLVWDGKIVAQFSHQRLRERPPSGGVAVYAESIPLSPSLLTQSRALLGAFGWQGVAMIEYKVDAETGSAYLMEINGRFWGSLQLALDAGADFPALLVAAAMDENPQPVTEYSLSTRTRWFWGDVDHLLARLRRSPRALALPPGAPPRRRAIASFFWCRPGDKDSTFRWRDPVPFFRETVDWIRAVLPAPSKPA